MTPRRDSLIVGDTHVGYRHRRRDKKAKGAKDLDARDRFQAVMDQANTLDADAIVHAGDIFDHVAIGADRSFVMIDALNSELNIPFYYIYGTTMSLLAVEQLMEQLMIRQRLSVS